MECGPTENWKADSTANKIQTLVKEGSLLESRQGGRKRGREEEQLARVVEKRGCAEGMSWWTCLMLGVSQEKTQPWPVRKVYTEKSNNSSQKQ